MEVLHPHGQSWGTTHEECMKQARRVSLHIPELPTHPLTTLSRTLDCDFSPEWLYNKPLSSAELPSQTMRDQANSTSPSFDHSKTKSICTVYQNTKMIQVGEVLVNYLTSPQARTLPLSKANPFLTLFQCVT